MENNTKKELALKLRKYRENSGLSQIAVANALGMERSSYTVYETGRSQPKISTLIKIANILNIDPAVLLTSENQVSLKDTDSKNTSPIYSLKKDEQQLILLYRAMSNEEKSELLAKITKKAKTDK